MKKFDLSKFDEYRENNRLEVKKAQGGLPNSLWETYSSMANCYGGVIILGVLENKDGSFRTTGLKDAAKMQKEFWDCVNNSKKVSLNLLSDDDIEIYDQNDDVIMVINMPRASREQKPVYINNDLWNGTFRRNWEGDYHCTKSEIKAMLRDEPEDTMDMEVLEDFELADLNPDTIRGSRNYHAAVRPGHVWEKLSNEEYLQRIGAAAVLKHDKKLHPTVAGLLMFGEEFKIVRHFPEYFLDYRETLDPQIRWTDRIQSSSGDWSGNLFDFFFAVYNRIAKDIEKPFALDGVTRIDDTSVHKALREAIANCIANADFYLPRGIVIIKEQDGIILQNPGSIRTGKEQMLRGGISDPRNKAIMKMLNMISIGERAGSGVPDIYSVWAEKNWEQPKVEEQFGPDRTILELSFRKKQTIKTNDKKQTIKTNDKKQTIKVQEHVKAIIDYLKQTEEAKGSEIAKVIGLSSERTRVILAQMEAIEAVGGNKNRKYRLKKEAK